MQTPREDSCLKNDGLFSAPDDEAGCRVHVSVETFHPVEIDDVGEIDRAKSPGLEPADPKSHTYREPM